MEDKQLEDDFSLGDVDKNLSSKKMSNKMKYIIIGSVFAFLLLIIIILIILISSSPS